MYFEGFKSKTHGGYHSFIIVSCECSVFEPSVKEFRVG